MTTLVEQDGQGGIRGRVERLVDDVGGGGGVEPQPGAKAGHGILVRARRTDVLEEMVGDVGGDLGVA